VFCQRLQVPVQSRPFPDIHCKTDKIQKRGYIFQMQIRSKCLLEIDEALQWYLVHENQSTHHKVMTFCRQASGFVGAAHICVSSKGSTFSAHLYAKIIENRSRESTTALRVVHITREVHRMKNRETLSKRKTEITHPRADWITSKTLTNEQRSVCSLMMATEEDDHSVISWDRISKGETRTYN
jgi:hypothetical protein